MVRRFITRTAVILALGMSPVRAQESHISLSDAQVARLGIRQARVEPAARQALAVVPGQITTPLDARLTMTAPFAGTVLSVQTLEGTKVRAGDDLLVIASNEYLAMQSQHAQAKADYRALKASADRLKILSDEGIVARARVEAADADAARAEADIDAAARLLSQVKPVQGQPGAYSLVAPIGATIARLQVRPGDRLEALGGAVVLEQAGALWLEAELPSRFVGQVAIGDTVTLDTYNLEGKVIAVGRIVDRKSRSATLRAVLEDQTTLKPGQSVQATITATARVGAQAVPREALVRLSGSEVVFMVVAGGYQAVPVAVLARGDEVVIVTGTLQEGAAVAISGLTELKALAAEGQ